MFNKLDHNRTSPCDHNCVLTSVTIRQITEQLPGNERVQDVVPQAAGWTKPPRSLSYIHRQSWPARRGTGGRPTYYDTFVTRHRVGGTTLGSDGRADHPQTTWAREEL